MTLTQEQYERYMPRIIKGARWLDKNKPGWRDTVVLNKLNLASGCACVLGQVFDQEAREVYADMARDDTWDARQQIASCGYQYVVWPKIGFAKIKNHSASDRWSQERGFDHAPGDDYAELTEAWKVYLKATTPKKVKETVTA